ncbi:hypothetical protein G6F50_017816 [Rhizopus delemar]|uniref:Uncharacterized protein n=1 Tax=Rhizopus delemar TaxID=936053 RepID=A0A9P6XNZ1_9FUNG|nr:hypothetical protein G6F50_017816 [Rhizopus delemar]
MSTCRLLPSGVPGALPACQPAGTDRAREGDLLALRTDHPAHAAGASRCSGHRSGPLEGDHRWGGPAACTGATGTGTRHRHLRWLWHVGDLPAADRRPDRCRGRDRCG